MCQALSLLSPAHRGHRGLFVPCPRLLPGSLRAQGLFCLIRWPFKLLSFKWKRRIAFRATPQITAGNKAAQGLILFDGTRAGFFSHNSILSVLGLPQKLSVCLAHLLSRNWTAAMG